VSRVGVTFDKLWRARRELSAALAAFCLLSAAGCASYTDETREIRSLYKNNQYSTALAQLEKSSIKDESRNRLLYHLEKAMILDRMGEAVKARKLLIQADKIADQLYTTSISKTAASFLVNDAMTDYEGEDYERVAIHTELALSYIGTGDLANARVEARKINSKLAEINQAYDNHKNHYAEDAFARYLSGAIYEARGEWDDAIIDYGKALSLYRGSYSKFVTDGVPDELVEADYRLLVKRHRSDRAAELEKQFPKQVQQAKKDLAGDKGDIVVVHELGHIATKSAGEFIFPFGRQLIRFSFPVIRKTYHDYFGATGVIDVKTGRFTAANNVQDMDAIARSCLDDRRLRLIAKQSARLIAKGQITEQAYKHFGPIGGIAANIFSVVTETADTRSWTLLPEAYFITRVRLPVGKHQIKIESGGRIDRIVTVDVKKGKVQILRDIGE